MASAPEWVQAVIPEGVESVTAEGLSTRLATLLVRRGVETPAAAAEFLEPSLEGLHDPGSDAGHAGRR